VVLRAPEGMEVEPAPMTGGKPTRAQRAVGIANL
jgi:hypothetical protein